MCYILALRNWYSIRTEYQDVTKNLTVTQENTGMLNLEKFRLSRRRKYVMINQYEKADDKMSEE